MVKVRGVVWGRVWTVGGDSVFRPGTAGRGWNLNCASPLCWRPSNRGWMSLCGARVAVSWPWPAEVVSTNTRAVQRRGHA